MTNQKKLDMMPAAIWLANTLSIVGIGIAGWVLVTVSALNAEVDSLNVISKSNKDSIVRHSISTDLHMPADRKFELFVTRGEYEAAQVSRSNEMADIKLEVRRGNAMLSELLERISRMEGQRE